MLVRIIAFDQYAADHTARCTDMLDTLASDQQMQIDSYFYRTADSELTLRATYTAGVFARVQPKSFNDV